MISNRALLQLRTLRSIARVLQRWAQYAANAAIASDTLAREHDPRNLARALAARGV